jgi:hypothetical protein
MTLPSATSAREPNRPHCAHAYGIADPFLREGTWVAARTCWMRSIQDGGTTGACIRLMVCDFERERRGIGLEGESQAVDARCGAVLDAELQLLAIATQVEI